MTQHVIAESIKVDFHNHHATTRQANSMTLASHNPFHHLHHDTAIEQPPLMLLNSTTAAPTPSMQDMMAKYKVQIDAWKLLSDDSKYDFIVQHNKQLNLHIPTKDQFLARLRSRSPSSTNSIPQQYKTVAANTATLDNSTPLATDSVTDNIPDAAPDTRLTFLMSQVDINTDDTDDDDHIFTPQLFNFTTIRVTKIHFETFLGNMHTNTIYSYAVSDGGGG